MRNSISRWQIPRRRKWNVKLTCCSSFPWFAQFSIVLSSSFDRILYRLPYRTSRTTAYTHLAAIFWRIWRCKSTWVRSHHKSVCLQTLWRWAYCMHMGIKHVNICTRGLPMCVCVVFSHLLWPCRQHDRLRSSIFKCARRTEIIYSGSGACIESINLTFTYHTVNRAHVLHLHNKCCATKNE